MRRKDRARMLVLLSLLAAACARAGVAARDEGVETLVRAGDRFALALHAALAKQDAGNLFFSPLSISMALGMTAAGAGGPTRDELHRALHWEPRPEDCPAAFLRLRQTLAARARTPGVTLRIRNRAWVQTGRGGGTPFAAEVERIYGAAVHSADFAGNPLGALQAINEAIRGDTGGRVPRLLTDAFADPLQQFVLTSSAYFQGRWAGRFDRGATTDAKFRLADGRAVKVPMMRQSETFAHAATESHQTLVMPYQGGAFAMVVMLPRKPDGIGELETQLTPENLDRWVADCTPGPLRVEFPRFSFSTTNSLRGTLQSMGVGRAFDPSRADFRAVSGTPGTCLYDVLHSACVEVDENGTTAWAVTAAAGGGFGPAQAPPVFCADHPFLFFIAERSTGAILFFGRVMDPSPAAAPAAAATP